MALVNCLLEIFNLVNSRIVVSVPEINVLSSSLCSRNNRRYWLADLRLLRGILNVG